MPRDKRKEKKNKAPTRSVEKEARIPLNGIFVVISGRHACVNANFLFPFQSAILGGGDLALSTTPWRLQVGGRSINYTINDLSGEFWNQS